MRGLLKFRNQWRIQGRPPSPFLDQTEARRAKKFFGDRDRDPGPRGDLK